MHAELLQSCPILCHPTDHSPPDSSVHGILQAGTLGWVAMYSPPGNLPDPGIERASFTFPALAGKFFTTSTTWEALSHLGPLDKCPETMDNFFTLKSLFVPFLIPCLWKGM